MLGAPDSYRESSHLHLVGRAEDNLSRVIGDLKKFTTKKLIHRIQTELESRREWILHQFMHAAKLDKLITNYLLWQPTSHPIVCDETAILSQKMVLCRLVWVVFKIDSFKISSSGVIGGAV